MDRETKITIIGYFIGAILIILALRFIFTNKSCVDWFNKPISTLNAGDLLLIVIIGAFMSRK